MEIKFLVVTNANRFSKSAFSNFLYTGIAGVLKLAKFDYKEPLKKHLTIDSFDEVSDMFNNYSNLILKGKDKSSISVKQYREGVVLWMGYADINEDTLNEDLNDVITLLECLAENNQMLFGKICTVDEHDAKHKVTTEHSYGWEGTSINDFLEYLPGIYWYTIFGKELVWAIGEKKMLNISNVVYTNPGDGCIGFYLNETINADNYDKRIETENAIVQEIGRDFFFNKNEKIRYFSHPRVFKDYLASLSMDK